MKFTYETLNILFILMPGFISANLIDVILRREGKDVFSKISEALIFSLLIIFSVEIFFSWEPIVAVEVTSGTINYNITKNINLLFLTLAFSLLYAITFSATVHHDLHMKVFRYIKLTDKTSRQTAWDDVFTEQKKFIVCHLSDDRRIYGWPMYYSNDKDEGFIYLYKPSWISNDDKYIECNTHGLLLRNEDVTYVEFINDPGEENE